MNRAILCRAVVLGVWFSASKTVYVKFKFSLHNH